MRKITKEWLDFLQEQYPVGSRIRLREIKDPYCPVEPGSEGTLVAIDDIGTFLVQWDNGRDLGLIFGEDSFTVLPPLQTLKLYMPMTVDCFEDDYGDEIVLGPQEAAEYAPQIIAALDKECRKLEKRGLMAYYYEADSVAKKVHSYYFTAEVRDRQLWGVAVCEVQGELTEDELNLLKEDITGQASDGFGESFEQREIRVDGGLEIYAHLWQRQDWSIQTEQELSAQQMGGITFG